MALAFLADRMFASHLEKQKTEEDKLKFMQDEGLKIKKNQLRHFSKTNGGDQVMMEVAQRLSNGHTKKISDKY